MNLNSSLPNEMTCDLCVLGCGPGGFSAAVRGLDLGKHVCVVEKDEIGGAGVMWGALASKTMWELSRDYAIAAKVDRGYRASSLGVDFPSLRQAVLKAVKEKQYQMFSQIETYSPQRWKGGGSLTLLSGKAGFCDKNTIMVTHTDNTTTRISAGNILIATGSKPRRLSHIHVDQERVLDSDGILNLKTFPERLVIVGAGVIGCEYATIFSSFGQTQVFLVDHKDRVLPYEDTDVIDFVSKSLQENGVEIIHSAKLREIRTLARDLRVILDFDDGHTRVLEADTVFLSVGRVPNLEELDLENAGIRAQKQGYIKTDDDCRVTQGIYAAGDVTHYPALVNMAQMEARHAVEHMFGMEPGPMNYDNMSFIMFFHPEVAAVGLSEKDCMRKKIPFRAATCSIRLITRAIAMRSLNGFVKIITDENTDRILGMRAAGPHVSSMIVSIAHFMDHNLGVKDVLKSLYPHPTVSEGIQECLRLLAGESLYKPHAFPGLLNLKEWRP